MPLSIDDVISNISSGKYYAHGGWAMPSHEQEAENIYVLTLFKTDLEDVLGIPHVPEFSFLYGLAVMTVSPIYKNDRTAVALQYIEVCKQIISPLVQSGRLKLGTINVFEKTEIPLYPGK